MEILRYKYIFVLIAVYLAFVSNAQNSTTVCPFTKIIEDIYKIHNNKTSKDITLKDHERAKIFLNSIAKVTINDDNTTKTSEAELVNDIIASINRIKSNMTPVNNNNDNKMNEAIILNISKENQKNVSNRSELDNESKENNKLINLTTNIGHKKLNKVNSNTTPETPNVDKIIGHNSSELNSAETSAEPINYVEILTIEPNNTNTNNSTSHNIIEVLKHLMPMFNSTLAKEHNITIIESTHSKNSSVNSIKNMSTIIVTFCEKENLTKANVTYDSPETDIKHDASSEYDYSSEEASYESDDDYDDKIETNLTVGEKKDILEATKYGVQKMHELYSVLEPKLYSMGLWLDDANPARYVAAFNAPSEDVAKYSRYGYASLQAATKLKQLISGSVGDGLQSRADEVQFPAASALRQSPLLQHCPLKGAPKCPPASKRYRTHDGTCNNLNRPRWGSTMTPVQRFLTPSYSDGLQAPRRSVTGIQLPSAREISSLIHENANVENPSITHLLMQWGQFLDHDVTSSSQSRGFNGSVPRCCKDGGRDFIAKEFLHPECMPIAVPPSDPFYGPRGVRCLDFIRSSPAPRDDCALGWREQLNQVSAYIDASPVYASSAQKSDRLRSFRNGMLQYGRSQQRRDELCRGGAVSTDCFKSGDARVNEHPGLVAAHIVWLRQHNRMAQELASLNPQWSDEKIYQETRRIVGAMVQLITYREFLPIVLGSEVMRLFELEPLKKGFFKGYDPKVNPSPASSFGSAAFRFGHSLVQSSMVRFDRFHRPLNNNVSLHDELTNLSNIWSIGAVDRLLLGMVNQPIQKRDEFITEELTNHLFQTPSFNFGMDLAAINIQRGRDHGVPAYTDWREPCGLTAIRSFGDLFKVMPMRVVRKLQNIYRHVDDIDLFTGGMAERPVVGGLVGPTFACIIAQQFSNLRKGDRFWYENGGFDSSFTPAQLQQIRRISFAQILCHTLDAMETIQPFVFLSSDNTENGRISCRNGILNNFDLSPWIEINSEFNNDIRQANDDDNEPPTRKPTTQKPKRPKPTTTRRPTTTKKASNLVAVASNKVSHKKPAPANFTDTNKLTERQNKTESTMNDNNNATDIFTLTVSGIDDKLDFRNKTKRFDDTEPKEKTRHNVKTQTKQQYNDYDDDDNVQSVQTVVINNLPHKRPYNNNYHNRPIMTVTENIDKYTYLINYVPRPTESYRPTTRRTLDRDVVKVTYQTYADTYRRPNKPYYYNRHDDENNNDYYRNERPVSDFQDNFYRRHERPNLHSDKSEILHSSARSNEDIMSPKPTATLEKTDNNSPTTDNLYKLVTFGYVGTYKGNNIPEKTTKTTDSRPDTISKDFSTYDNTDRDNEKTMKLSTFFSYETATKPYSNLQRSTRRHDDDLPNYKNSNTKYYYVKNVLHKYPTDDINSTDKPIDSELKDITLNNKNIPNILENVEERSVADKLDFFDDEEKSNKPPNKVRIKTKKPASPAKTPSVAFQVIPSENTPYQWAIYDEKEDLPESLPHNMPPIKTDPHALKETPKPMIFNLRRRRPGRS